MTIVQKDRFIENETPFGDLPEGWESTPLKALANFRKGKKPDRLDETSWAGAIPYIDIEAFERGNIRRYADLESSAFIDKGEIIVVWDGARCGHVGKAPKKGALGSTLGIIKPILIHPEYILRFLQLSYDTINTNPRGIGIPHVEPELFWNLEVPLAPIAEQNRIVTKVEELFTRVSVAKEGLSNATIILKRFRQSVLAAACSGRLTSDWREEKLNVEPADNLIRRIRDKRLKEAKSSREKERIINLYEESKRRSVQNNVEQDLPEAWAFCEVNELGDVCNGSTPSRKHPEYWGGDIPWISSGEIQNNIINETRETMSKEGYNNSSVRMLPVGTVLLAMIGEGKTRGQTAILNLGSTINQNIAAVIIDHGLISSKYLWYWFQFQYEITRQVGGGSGPQALNCQRVRELSLNLPPLEEQDEISRRVECLFKLADTIEKRVAAASLRAEKLTQSILAKAFRGELVPTEAELARRDGRPYETASELLARIKSERQRKEALGRTHRSRGL